MEHDGLKKLSDYLDGLAGGTCTLPFERLRELTGRVLPEAAALLPGNRREAQRARDVGAVPAPESVGFAGFPAASDRRDGLRESVVPPVGGGG